MAPIATIQGPKGSLATFLRDLGPTLLEKYKPKAVVVFSAHWESEDEILVSDYAGEDNPLFYDCRLFFPSSFIEGIRLIRVEIGSLWIPKGTL